MKKYKVCSYKKCVLKRKSQPIKNFYPNRTTKDGLDYYCKDCSKKHKKDWVKKNLKKVKKIQKIWQKNNPIYYKNYYKKNRRKLKEQRKNWWKKQVNVTTIIKKYKICPVKNCIYKRKPQLVKNFYKNKKMKDGLSFECKNCSKKSYKVWKKKNLGRPSWSKRNPERARVLHKRFWTKNPNYDKKWKNKNREKVRKINRDCHQKRKKNIFNHYGNKCIKCNEKDLRVLDINHINGSGTKHIKSLGDFYCYIIRNNYSSKFNVLCANCNWIDHDKKRLKIPYLNKKNFSVWLKTLSSIKRKFWKRKFEIINHYTKGKMHCTLCPQNDIRVLTVDYVTPVSYSGKKHLTYSQLIKENFPSGIRILCRNCQRIAYQEWKKDHKEKSKA